MSNESIQKYCEKIEDLLDRECHNSKLSYDDFNTINLLLLALQMKNLYKLNN